MKHHLILSALLLTAMPTSALTQGIGIQKQAVTNRNEELIVSVGGLAADSVRVFDVRTGDLKRTINHAAWFAVNSRVVALDPHDHLWVGDDVTNSLYQFDTDYRFVRSFPIDTACAGSPGGSGVRSHTFTQQGELFLVGSWASGTVNYLFEVDPQTEQTVRCADLNSLAGAPFEPTRVTAGPDGYLYMSSWSGSPSTRILVVDPNPPGGGFQTVTLLAPGGLETLGGTVVVLPSDSILIGAGASGLTSSSIWLSDVTQTNWVQLMTCPTSGSELDFAVGHGLIFTNGTSCDAGLGNVAVYKTDGTFSGSFSLTQGGAVPMQNFQSAVIRH